MPVISTEVLLNLVLCSFISTIYCLPPLSILFISHHRGVKKKPPDNQTYIEITLIKPKTDIVIYYFLKVFNIRKQI